MSSGQYFIRSRGRVSGPFALDALQKLAKRGSVSRFDEISTDQRNWTAAESVTGVFVSPTPRPSPQTQSASPLNGSAAAAVASAAPPPPPREVRYFYTQRGVEVGPVDASLLKSLAASGGLGPRDVVWAEGAEAAHEAAQIPILASIFTAPASRAAGSSRTSEIADETVLRRTLRHADNAAMIVGLVAGGLLLLLMNLPIAAPAGKMLFWWHAEPLAPIVLGSYVTLSGIAFIVLVLALRRLGRSIPLLSVAGIAIASILVWSLVNTGLTNERFGGAVWLVAPALTIVVAVVARWRSVCGMGSYRPLAITIGAIVIVTYVALGITAIVALAEPGMTVVPSWVKLLLVFLILQALCGIAAGILSIISGSAASAGPARTTLLLSILCLGLTAITAMTLIGGMASTAGYFAQLEMGNTSIDPDAMQLIIGWVIFLFVRVFLMLACYVAVIGAAVSEILASVAMPSASNNSH